MRNLKKILSVLIAVIMAFSCLAVATYAQEAQIGDNGKLNVMSYDLQSYRAIDDVLFSISDVVEAGSVINALKYDIVAVQEDFDVKWEDYPIGVEVPDYHGFFVSYMKNYADVVEDKTVDGDVLDGVIDGVIDSIIDDACPTVLERHQTITGGDGLGIYSTYSIFNTDRQRWNVSEHKQTDGAPQLYDTGFVVTTIKLAEGYYLDIYNVSADEYNNEDAIEARKAQFEQLANYIKKHSVYDEELGVYDHAVIVLGNLNAGLCEEESTYGYNGIISTLIEGAALNDAWAVSNISEITEDPETYDAYYNYAENTELTFEQSFGHYDSAEKILYADGNGIDLSLNRFDYAVIKGAAGASLSDHSAAIAQLSYEIVEKTYEYGNEKDDENADVEESWLVRFLNSIANIFKAIGYFFQSLFN